MAEATAGRAERKALAARTAAAEAVTGVERGARLPQVALTGSYTYANPNRDIVPPTSDWTDTWDVGVGVSWSVFDGGRRSANEARASAQADAARQQLRELDRCIRLEVTQRALELRTAEARLGVAERSVVSAAESRRVAADRYREGVIPSSELLDAELAQRAGGTRAHRGARGAAPERRRPRPGRGALSVGDGGRAPRAQQALRRLQGRRPGLARRERGRDLRLPRRERRRQVHHDPDALRAARPHLRHRHASSAPTSRRTPRA